jgi:hypothetical protein
MNPGAQFRATGCLGAAYGNRRDDEGTGVLCSGLMSSHLLYIPSIRDGDAVERVLTGAPGHGPTGAMSHVLRATCYKVGFPRKLNDFSGGGRLFHVLHATN